MAHCGPKWSNGEIMTDIQIIQLPPIPIMHWRKFAEVVGLDEGVLRGMCEKDYIPSIVLGKHRFINLVKLTQLCLEKGGN